MNVRKKNAAYTYVNQHRLHASVLWQTTLRHAAQAAKESGRALFLPLCAATIVAMGDVSTARTWVVHQKHPLASDTSEASEAAPYRTINRAAERARPGDTVLVYGGVYRERVAPESSGTPQHRITYMAAPGEKVVIKGSDIWTPKWTHVKGQPDVFTAPLDSSLFRCRSSIHDAPDYNPYAVALVNAPWPQCLGQLFVDGIEYRQVATAEQVRLIAATWIAEMGGKSIRVHFSPGTHPKERTIELTTRGRIFAPYRRGVSYITVRGFIMEHCANQYPENFYVAAGPPQAGALGCRGGTHWIIERNTIRHAKTVGIDCGREGPEDADGLNQPQRWRVGFHIIRDNIVASNGAAGIIGESAVGCLIYGNVIDCNNTEGIRGMEGAGMKFHEFNDGLIEGNLVRGNTMAGVWIDNEHRNTRITRNVIIGNVGAGIFIELGRGPALIDNNVIAHTVAGGGNAGDGLYSHDASGVTVAHNLFYFNANFGLWIHVGTDRGQTADAHCSNWRIVNNIIIGNHRGAVSMPPVSPRSNDNLSDYNLIAGSYGFTMSETWGAELERPLFLVNTNKDRNPIDSTAARFSVLLDSMGVAHSLRPNLRLWKDLPLLDFDQWRLLSGNDRHSLWPIVIRPECGPLTPSLYLIIDRSPMKLGCREVLGVDRDLFGNPMPTTKPLPGPFQNLVFEPALADRHTYATPLRGNFEKLNVPPQRANSFVLWPLPRIERQDYLQKWEKTTQEDSKRTTAPQYSAGSIGSTKNPVAIPYSTDTIIIDGDGGEWWRVKPLPAPFSNKDSGMVLLQWRNEGIYGLLRAPWRRIRNSPQQPWFQTQESLELFFQTNGAKTFWVDSFTLHGLIFPIPNRDSCVVNVYRAWDIKIEHRAVAKSRPLTSGGHAVEFFLPADLFAPNEMREGMTIGFNYTVNARGEALEEFYVHRDFDEAFRRPILWGTARLAR